MATGVRYDNDPSLARTRAELPRNDHGLAVFEAPGIENVLTRLLDILEPLAGEPTLLDGLSNHFLRLARLARLKPGPKVDADMFNVSSDFKFSVQAGIASAQTMRTYQAGAELQNGPVGDLGVLRASGVWQHAGSPFDGAKCRDVATLFVG